MHTVTLENATLSAVFDTRTGALLELRSRLTGWRIQRRAELGRSFQMHIPLPDRRNNNARGETQPPPRMRRAGDVLTFRWDTIRSEHGGEHAIAFEGTVELGPDGLRFSATLENRSALTVESVAWPTLGDLSPAARDRTLTRWWTGYSSANAASLYPTCMGEKGQWGVDHNMTAAIHNHESLFTLVGDCTEGLYIGLHDPALRHLTSLYFDYAPGYLDYYHFVMPTGDDLAGIPVHLTLYTVHFAFAAPGESTVLTPVVLQPYHGTWHKGVDLYKRWRSTWHRSPRRPAWVEDIHAWHQYQVSGAEDDLRLPFRRLVELARDCARHGVKAIQLVGWNHGGQDRGNPFHDPDPRLGTPEDLTWAIREAEKLGVKIVLFSKFTWMDQSLPWFKDTGVRFATRDPYGNYHVNSGCQYQTFTQLTDLNTRRMVPTCNPHAEWRAVAVNEVRKLGRLGAPGMLYDELMHHGLGLLCFAPDHGHHVPAHNFSADLGLAREFEAAGREFNPDFLLAGEDPNDVHQQVYHLSYFRFAHWSHMHLTRYIDPYLPMMPGIFGFDDRNMLNKCLQYRYLISYEPYNFKGRLDDFPLTLEYGRQIDALRRRYRDWLWDAEFRDCLGAAVTAVGRDFNPLDYAVFHRADGRRAVVVCNVDETQPVTVTVTMEEGNRGQRVAVTPEQQDPQPVIGPRTLPPRSACVFLET